MQKNISEATQTTSSGPTSEQVGTSAYPYAWDIQQCITAEDWGHLESVPRWLLCDAVSLGLPPEHIERVRYTAHLVTELINQLRTTKYIIGVINARKPNASMDT